MTIALSSNCPLCHSNDSHIYCRDKHRTYRQCPCCHLVFVELYFHLSHEQEKAIYDQHQNSPQDQGYRHFLSRLATPMQERLTPGCNGLDFGCGPGPTLSLMFQEAGYSMALFDIFYHPDQSVLQHRYDFITATEVVEHLSRPAEVLQQLWQCLKPNGLLGIMTKLVSDPTAFSRWHYKNDPTHISFFSRETFQWLAKQWQAELELIGADVIIFKKNSGMSESQTRALQPG